MDMERFWTGKAFEQDGLRERLQSAAARSLQDAGQQDDGQRRRSSAEERGDGEDDDADEQKALATKAAGEPVGGGKDDGIGHQVAGEHPGGLGVGGREASGNVGQRDRGDGGVEHLHEGGQHDRNGDQPRIDALGEGIALVGRGGIGPDRGGGDGFEAAVVIAGGTSEVKPPRRGRL